MIRAGAVLIALAAACAAPSKTPDPVVSETSKELFVRSVTALFRGTAKMPAETLEELLEAENNVPDSLAAELLRYSTPGAEAARAMIKADPENAEAHLLLAIHLSMQGIAKGKTKSFFEGLPSEVIDAYEEAMRINRGAMSAGPLQVQGRFRTVVAFPYRDIDEAQAALVEATKLAPTKQTLFYLGDAYAWQGNLDEARTAWNRSLSAKTAPTSAAIAPFLDQLVQRRLQMIR